MSAARIANGLGPVAAIATLLMVALATGPAGAQIFNFHHYDTDDGLPQVQVLSVYRDAQGYLWVGTYGGLSRYNGQNFRNFTTEDGLGANVVEAITVDDAGTLWAGTGAGLCRLDRDDEQFKCLDESGLGEAYIYGLHAEPGGLWVAAGTGLYERRDGRLQRFGKASGLPAADTRAIERDNAGNLWVGTTEGVARRAAGAEDFEAVALPPGAGRKVSSLLAEGDQVWIGTDHGLYRYRDGAVEAVEQVPEAARVADVADLALDREGDLWVATNLGMIWRRHGDFHLLTRHNGLRYNISFSLFAGAEGLVWIGHDQGLTKWVPSSFVGYRAAQGLIDSFVRTINEDNEGNLWLGTRSGIQVVPYRDGDWRFKDARTIAREDGLQDERVYSIAFVAPGEALIATDYGVARWRRGEGVVTTYTKSDGLPANQAQALLQDSHGRIWIGTNLGTVVLEDGAIRPVEDAALGGTYVYRFREDGRGRVWAAARDGLFIIGPGGQVERLTAAAGLTDRTLWDLAPDGNDGMWAGSNGDGLFHVHGDGRIARYTTEDGLVDNFVWQVLRDPRGDIWAYTNRGLSRFDGNRFVNYNRNDGLLHEEGGATGAWGAHTGDLWFASADGLMRYDPEYEYDSPPPPNVVIERVELAGREIAPGDILPAQVGTLDFHYAALGFRSEEEMLFRYRLAGLSEAWSDPRRYRPVTFGNLGGGEYAFQVQARLPGQAWAENTASFAFTVRPAIWETVWFWALAAMTLSLVVLGLFHLQARRSEARRHELEAVVQERTEELEEANRKLQDASITDPLTGLHNRRFLVNQITKDTAQSQRAYRGPPGNANRDVIFMMIDLDQFKEVNDTYGHLAGDSVLKQYANLIQDQLRESDYVVRWGGEEFLVVARQAEASQCNVIGRRMVEAARRKRFEVSGVDEPVVCTCSVGISHFPFIPGQPDALHWEQIVDIADKAVYMAKLRGRDGWVAIHGTGQTRIRDAAEFLRRLRDDPEGLEREQQIRTESSFG